MKLRRIKGVWRTYFLLREGKGDTAKMAIKDLFKTKNTLGRAA